MLGSGLATYADATVICGALARDPVDANAATNPTVVICVEHYERLEDGSWRYSVHGQQAHLGLAAIGVELPVAVLYEDVPDP